MENKKPPLPFFMTYPYQEQGENIMMSEADRDYFRQLYPKEIKRYLRIIIEVLDRMDIRESYIYDEYPDKLSMERLSEVILKLIPLENNLPRETQRNLVKVLLYEEIVQRRKKAIRVGE